MPTDDKSPICIPFILTQLSEYCPPPTLPNCPLFIGLNGPQGIGKTTLVTALSRSLTAHDIPHLVCSIDDFYLTRNTQAALAVSHPNNPLLSHRGEPGTHDIPLLLNVLAALERGEPTDIPRYDKAAFSGLGDRAPKAEWTSVNAPGERKVRVVLLEGCLETLLEINEYLKTYDAVTEKFGAFIHIAASDVMFVYEWRLQQERELRKERGIGMTDEQVVTFVDGYFPAYELYLSSLLRQYTPQPQKSGTTGHYLRILVDRDRSVLEHYTV
ncbi:putative kinase mug58 [Ceratocystis lukuohia]|uniref:Kinase mug58 n=1 Tax=Ceratocystis lukuohia TaxID=2019550 RepID=A0ABR4MTL0_9PEZI